MNATALLKRYQNKRSQLLKTIKGLLENDPAVKAAWLDRLAEEMRTN